MPALPLTPGKWLAVIHGLSSGKSYSEIHVETGVSMGKISDIYNQLKNVFDRRCGYLVGRCNSLERKIEALDARIVGLKSEVSKRGAAVKRLVAEQERLSSKVACIEREKEWLLSLLDRLETRGWDEEKLARLDLAVGQLGNANLPLDKLILLVGEREKIIWKIEDGKRQLEGIYAHLNEVRALTREWKNKENEAAGDLGLLRLALKEAGETLQLVREVTEKGLTALPGGLDDRQLSDLFSTVAKEQSRRPLIKAMERLNILQKEIEWGGDMA